MDWNRRRGRATSTDQSVRPTCQCRSAPWLQRIARCPGPDSAHFVPKRENRGTLLRLDYVQVLRGCQIVVTNWALLSVQLVLAMKGLLQTAGPAREGGRATTRHLRGEPMKLSRIYYSCIARSEEHTSELQSLRH